MTKTIEQIAHSSQDEQLLCLLENETLAIDPQRTVEIAASDNEQSQVAAAFETLVLDVLQENSTNSSDKIMRVKQILEEKPQQIENLNNRVEAAVEKIVAPLLEKINVLENDNRARCLLETAGINPADIEPEKIKLLTELTDESAMQSLVESWPPYVKNPHVRTDWSSAAVSPVRGEPYQDRRLPVDGQEMARQLR